MLNYSSFFYNTYVKDSKQSAEQVLPLISSAFKPNKVVDVGCGIGTWLTVFEELGVNEILGIDGDYVNTSQLLISKEKFLSHDLTKPYKHSHTFDLAVSLEVGEHLPLKSAPIFVETLVNLAPVVLFSAAIPEQTGTFHINEQWPNFWAKLFHEKGYLTVDWLRPKIWDNDKVSYYYAQNSLIFVKKEFLHTVSFCKDYLVEPDDLILSKVHPKKWMEANDPKRILLRKVIPAIPYAIKNAISFRLKKYLFRK